MKTEVEALIKSATSGNTIDEAKVLPRLLDLKVRSIFLSQQQIQVNNLSIHPI